MKKSTVFITAFLMLGNSMICSASGDGFPTDAQTWASFSDNQKYLYYALGEIEEGVTGAFEYLGNIYMADGSRLVVDLLFVEAPESEDGIYIYDIVNDELYDHINDKKVAEEFENIEQCINTLANCYQNYANGSDLMWMDSEIKVRMSDEDIQEVLAVVDGAVQSVESVGKGASVEIEVSAISGDEEALSKEEMLEQAEEVDANVINNESFENFARAKQNYCNKILKLEGMIQSIGEDHIELGYNSTYVVDVYLPIDEIMMLEVGQSVVVVGETTDEIIDSSQNIAEYSFEYFHYQMPAAYLVQDRFEITGILKGENASYAPAFNIQIGNSNVLKLIYFADSVDTGSLEFGQEIKFEAKCVYGTFDWEYYEAEIIE